MNKTTQAGIVLGMALAAPLGWAGTAEPTNRIERQVRRELITLPFYGVFDHFTYRVDGGSVTLFGKVSRPTLKTDAENAVKRIEGVERVTNQIQVLPLSPNDDRLRMTLYRAIYGHKALDTLAIRVLPPIAIIVENGSVSLEGVVATELQRVVAGVQANGVPGVFAVTNNLQVESKD